MTDDRRPYSKYNVLHCQTKTENVQPEPKSYAQVESLVSPQNGVTNSGGLKPEGKRTAQKKNIRKRANPLTVRLSDKDRAIIAQKAFNIGYSTNAYVRASALGSDYKPPISREMVMALLAVKSELTVQGNNLNQIAHSHNTNLHSVAETDTILGTIARSLLKVHQTVNAALTWGEKYPKD